MSSTSDNIAFAKAGLDVVSSSVDLYSAFVPAVVLCSAFVVNFNIRSLISNCSRQDQL
jgi:hypothetical protein